MKISDFDENLGAWRKSRIFAEISDFGENLGFRWKSRISMKILDFGANNLDNYAYLKKNLKNIEYFYHDLPKYNEFIEEFVKAIEGYK